MLKVKNGFYKSYLKRVMDVVIAICAIIILIPLFVIIAVLVRIMNGAPILFCQKRPGYKEKIFTLYKFRTMTNLTDEKVNIVRTENDNMVPDGKDNIVPEENNNMVPEENDNMVPDGNDNIVPEEKVNIVSDEERLHKFGRFLRSTSLDELPELFNILKGDMSIVGPRPLLKQYLPLYNEQQKRRHEVRPGLTGLAQISGRNNINWEEKFNLDIEYIDHISFIRDIKIILLTVRKVFLREGIHSETAATMEPFTGSKKDSIK